MNEAPIAIWTIGHSNLQLDNFLNLLTESSIEAIADVRRFPASRKYPHFNQDNLINSLQHAGIAYEYFPELGGRRHPRPDSQNTAWRNDSFRGYADHMETEEFAAGVGRLLKLATRKRIAIMCAEVLWWRCHRALISDHLSSRGVLVTHILAPQKTTLHSYTSAAMVIDGKLSYGAHG